MLSRGKWTMRIPDLSAAFVSYAILLLTAGRASPSDTTKIIEKIKTSFIFTSLINDSKTG